MTKFGGALTSVLVFGLMPAMMPAEELSKYRNFQLGADLQTVAKQAGVDPSRAKTIQSRPALIQDLDWRPQPLGSSAPREPAKDVVLTFYNGELFRIVIRYDRYETEGLTNADLIEAIAATYGPPSNPTAPKVGPERYGDQEETVAQWQDSQYSFDLIRSSYGPSFRLVGILNRLRGPVEAALLEAARLDDKEAPQREAEQRTKQDETERAKLEKARLVNKPKFRP
jgi:hypothetical protein